MASSETVKHTKHNKIINKIIAGVPARIMRPRLVFLLLAIILCMFGCLMVYSASSVTSLAEYGTATHFVERQVAFMAIGWFAIVFIYLFPMNFFSPVVENIAWGISAALLAAVLIVGEDAGGAVRWISIGSFIFQPSEFVKIVILMVAARTLAKYKQGEFSFSDAVVRAAILIGGLLGLIALEPDFGSTMIILAALAIMLWIAGIDAKLAAFVVVTGFIAVVFAIASAPYRLQRFLVVLDPWADPYGDGYQATLAIMAFASGGLFGRGIGNSTMKYNYLPEAHNDFILAIIGEELGFFGTLLFFALFIGLCWNAVRIARQCKDLHLRYFVIGCAGMLFCQFLVNTMGILSITPMTGKTLPLISYGGSSVLSTLLMFGLILRASRDSNEKTEADERRDNLGFVGANVVEMPAAREDLGVSEPVARSRRSSTSSARDFDNGYTSRRSNTPSSRNARTSSTPRAERSAYQEPTQGISNSGYGRINLGGGAKDRLRPSSGPVRRDNNRRNTNDSSYDHGRRR